MSTLARKKAVACVLVALGVAMTLSMISTGFRPIIHASFASSQEANALVQDGQSKSMTNNNTTTNIVLVHGGWADGTGWSKVIPILQKAGHKVIAVQLPLHTAADDIATVKRAIEFAGGPTILVGHSYGGFVITNAAYNNPSVKGLVYVAAFAPDQGESLGDFVNPAKIPKGLLIPDSAGFLYINSSQFHDFFAQDVEPTEAAVMAAAQKPFNGTIFSEKSGPPAWKQLPTWYQVSENDHAIPPDTERHFAQRMNATTISLPTSHVPYVSHPNEIAQLILNATEAVAQKSTAK
ncbi:MAG: alpha/beta hydrolase [Nitrososphaera sp.]